MSNACRIRHVVMPVKRKSTGSRRSRVMRNLHTKRRRHSRGRGKKHSRRKHSRGRGKKHSRRRHSRGHGKKHSRKHRRKHYVHHHKHSRNIGRAPLLDSFALRDIVLENKRPSTHRLQRKAMTSIVKDLEAMGLKTPSPQAKLGER